MGYAVVFGGLLLLGILLWISTRVRSTIEGRRGLPTRNQALNEAEALRHIDRIDPNF